MKRFSKNDYTDSAICNYCSKWQPLPPNMTHDQLEQIDWKCDECKAKEAKPQKATPPTEENRGSKAVSKYDPEYEFLIKLVALLGKEGVPPQEMKEISQAYPFETINDVGDLTAKLWTLATEKYHIPREWLIKKLPKNASLKTADLWPSQEQAGDMLSHEHNSLSYNNEQEADTSVSGPNPNDVNDDALWGIVVNEFFTAHKQWSEVVKAIQLAHPEVTPEALIALKDRARKSVDDQMGMIGSKDQTKIASDDLTQFALGDKAIRQHFQNRGTTVEDVLSSLPNFTIKYIPKELEKQDPTLASGTNGFYDFKTGTLYINPRLTLDSKRLTIIHEIEHAIQDASGVLPVHTENDLNQVKKTPYMDRTFEWGARQQQFNALKARGMSLDEIVEFLVKRNTSMQKYNEYELSYMRDNVRNEVEQMEDIYNEMMPESIMASKETISDSIDKLADQKVSCPNCKRLREYADVIQEGKCDQCNKEGVFSGAEFSTNDVGVNPSLDIGPYSSPEDHGKKPQKSPFPNTNWLPADDQNLDQQAPSNVAASTLNRPFSKKANPDSRYWIAPDGTEFPVSGIHPVWIDQNHKTLKKYGIDADNMDRAEIHNEMLYTGWVRISNEPAGSGFQIQVRDIRNLPAFLDNFIAKNFTEGDKIIIGSDGQGAVEVKDPFPSIQKVVNKQLMRTRASLKQAAISGEITNKILQTIHNNGGVTYNLSKGDMGGTPNYSVSVYPDRERIEEGGVDFDRLEGFIDDNEDLLKNPDNSIGAWTNNGKVYLDIVITTPDQEKAIDLAKQNNQIAIWDLQNAREISTGGTGGGQMTKAFSKKNLIKTAEILQPDDSNSLTFPILRNPDLDEVVHALRSSPVKQLRYIMDNESGDTYVWDAYDGTHDAVVLLLQQNSFDIADDRLHGFITDMGDVRSLFGALKTAEESLLSQNDQNEVAAASSPAYVIAVNNYAEALKRGHSKDRSLEYAIESVQNLEKVDPKKLVEFINTYVPN